MLSTFTLLKHLPWRFLLRYKWPFRLCLRIPRFAATGSEVSWIRCLVDILTDFRKVIPNIFSPNSLLVSFFINYLNIYVAKSMIASNQLPKWRLLL